MRKLQLNPTAETDEILNNLSQRNTKSIFVNMAIKYFAKTKEAKAFLKNDNDEEKELGKSIKNQAPQKKDTNKQNSTKNKVSLKEWD